MVSGEIARWFLQVFLYTVCVPGSERSVDAVGRPQQTQGLFWCLFRTPKLAPASPGLVSSVQGASLWWGVRIKAGDFFYLKQERL